jgi:hypothetical protein
MRGYGFLSDHADTQSDGLHPVDYEAGHTGDAVPDVTVSEVGPSLQCRGWRDPSPACCQEPVDPAPGSRQLLIRRNRTTGEPAYYRCYSPRPVPLAELVRVAGSRWRVEEFFQAGKGLAALDEHQVRRDASWSRWVTLAMRAHAFLAVVRADEHARHPAYRSPATRSSTCSLRSWSAPPGTPSTGSAGPTGDAATKPDPRPATTSGKPLNHEDHEVLLEYY